MNINLDMLNASSKNQLLYINVRDDPFFSQIYSLQAYLPTTVHIKMSTINSIVYMVFCLETPFYLHKTNCTFAKKSVNVARTVALTC